MDARGRENPVGIAAQLDSSNTPNYYLSDALGSVRGVTGTAGTLLGAGDYDVFGMERPGGNLTGSIRFAGEQWDGETNSSYLRARTMNAPLGRFLSADSAMPNGPGTQGYNAYSYAANNPANLTDPSGHDATASVSAVNPGLVPFAPLNFVAIPLTLAMPGALVACVPYVPGCAVNEPVAEGEAESALPQAEGPGAGALGVWAVICWLTPECLTEAFLWIDIVCNAWGGDACAVPLPGEGPRPAPTPAPDNPRNLPPEPIAPPPPCGGFAPGPYVPPPGQPDLPAGGGPGHDFTDGQRLAIFQQNREAFGDGQLHSDNSGIALNT